MCIPTCRTEKSRGKGLQAFAERDIFIFMERLLRPDCLKMMEEAVYQ